MTDRHSSLGSLLAAIAMLGLAQCGGKKSASGQISLEIIPPQPIVITADTIINGTSITNPWFKFYVNVTNGSDQPITVVAVKATITPPNSTSTVDWAEDPGSQSQTIVTGTSGATTTCNYTTYGTLKAGETKPLTLQPGLDVCGFPTHAFYVGALPKPDPGTTNYRYKVVLSPIGWFGTEDQPTDRFQNQITFFTQ